MARATRPSRQHPSTSSCSAARRPSFPRCALPCSGSAISTYEHFCKTAREIDRRLEELGGTRLQDRVECDVDYEEPAEAWGGAVLERLREEVVPAEDEGADSNITRLVLPGRPVESAPAYDKRRPFTAPVLENLAITGRGSSKEIRHVEIGLEGSGLVFEPGDSLGILPQNDPALVAKLIDTLALDGEEPIAAAEGLPLHRALAERFEITALTSRFLSGWAELSGATSLREIAERGDAALRTYATGRQVVDLVESFPVKGITGTELVGRLRRLPPRLYSIASSLAANPDEAHLCVSVVRYASHGRDRLGVASGWLAERVAEDGTVPVYVQSNPHFRLPKDPGTPIIMIGAGTGVAPYRAFMQEREEQGATGKSWLFFGDRSFRTDFLYQLEWQRWLKARHARAHRPRLLARPGTEDLRPASPDRARGRGLGLAPGGRASLSVRRFRASGARRPCRADAHRHRAERRRCREGHRLSEDPPARGPLPARRLLRKATTMDRSRDLSQPVEKLHANERLKAASDHLRGDIAEGLADPVTGGISEGAQQLIKFHGSYQQDDRDLREERRQQKLEPAYQFMVRVRLPGGVCTPAQWTALDDLARSHANGTLRLTTRQTFQFHGILKGDLKETIQGMDRALLELARRLRRRQPGRDERRQSASLGAARRGLRHGAAHQRAADAEDARLSRDLAGREEGGRRRVRAHLRRHLSAAEVQDRRGRAARQRRRRLHAGPGLHRRRRGRRASGLQRHGGRRHGPHRRRARHLSPARRRDRLLPAGAGAGRHRGRRHDPARLRRPRRPQARPLQVHDRRSRPRLAQGGAGAARRASRSSRRGRFFSRPTATAMAGPRATTAPGIFACSSRTGASGTPTICR